MNTKVLNIASVALVATVSAQHAPTTHHTTDMLVGDVSTPVVVTMITDTTMELSASEQAELAALEAEQARLAATDSSMDARIILAQQEALRMAEEATEAERIRITNQANSAADLSRIRAESIAVIASDQAMEIQRQEEAAARLSAELASQGAQDAAADAIVKAEISKTITSLTIFETTAMEATAAELSAQNARVRAAELAKASIKRSELVF